MINKKLQLCLEECIIEAAHCGYTCSHNNQLQYARCIKLNRAAVISSSLVVKAIAVNSDLLPQLRLLCTEICTACAEECERHPQLEYCVRSAASCRRAAVESSRSSATTNSQQVHTNQSTHKYMNNFKQFVWMLGIGIIFTACTTSPNVNQLLANKETRSAIIDTIANNEKMSREMMTAMMNSKDSMQQHIGVMMEMLRDRPGMMNTMMGNLMEASKKDSNMMIHMYENMMDNLEMMERMKQRMMKRKDTSMMPMRKQ